MFGHSDPKGMFILQTRSDTDATVIQRGHSLHTPSNSFDTANTTNFTYSCSMRCPTVTQWGGGGGGRNPAYNPGP